MQGIIFFPCVLKMGNLQVRFFLLLYTVKPDPVAFENLEPRGAGDIRAAILSPFDVGLGPQQAGPLFPHVLCEHEGTDVQTNTVVQVWVPADGLLLQRLPSHENVAGGLAFEDLMGDVTSYVS